MTRYRPRQPPSGISRRRPFLRGLSRAIAGAVKTLAIIFLPGVKPGYTVHGVIACYPAGLTRANKRPHRPAFSGERPGYLVRLCYALGGVCPELRIRVSSGLGLPS